MKKLIMWLLTNDFISHKRKLIKARRQHRKMIKATKIALERHKATKKRYYVMCDWEEKYHALNHLEIDYLKRAGILNKRITIQDLLREAVIYVDSSNYKTIEEKLKRKEL